MIEAAAMVGWVLAAAGWALWWSQRERVEDVREAAEGRVADAHQYNEALQTFIERQAFEERTAEAVQTEVDPEAAAQAKVDEDDINRVAAHVKKVAAEQGRDVSDKDAREEARRIMARHRERTSPAF